MPESPRTIVLYRRGFEHGTFGVLCDEFGNEICKTIERPWKDNAPMISCIPDGHYDLVPHQSPKFGKCYALDGEEQGVTIWGPSQRTHILIHVANRVDQLQGCIGVGFDFGVLKDRQGRNQWAVLDSRSAFNHLMHKLGGKPAKLIIKS
ncbi:DUF5675 family protein [Vibrio parahaemolyticus]|uniref:DUF5675 family protein n=1 Tax=Vibrio parahaemolyticus TaxID=670 RepID=UPI00146CC37F|nr:DUF5675 family protein [Vibrio parahaemolyticus]MDF5698383.1 DUF5675 family protein [Vibrio parahaemolyticus]NMU37898.1 hypothetical protein [Vibrio parahaemolyticus]